MDIEAKVLEVLKENREGVTLQEIADKLGVHRHTLTKYIYKLDGEGKIRVRKIGVAKLCYLSDDSKI